MPSSAIASHGTLLQVEQDPTGAQGTFTQLAEVVGSNLHPRIFRRGAEVTPHEDNIDSHVFGVLTRDPIQFQVNWVNTDATQDESTGLLDALLTNEKRGYTILGPGATQGGDVDEWVASGHVTSIDLDSAAREGGRQADITIQFSGPMKIDGTIYGS